MGSGAVAEKVVRTFSTSVLSDTHADLVAMWRAASQGWVPPVDITPADYAAARLSFQTGDPATALRGFIGFGCSFGGKWFGGWAHGGGRDYVAESSRAVARRGGVFSGANILHTDYAAVELLGAASPRSVVYADPPYQGTTGYTSGVDHEAFWATMGSWADAGSLVLVSEYSAPPGWRVLWEQEQAVTVTRRGVTATRNLDRLYTREDLL